MTETEQKILDAIKIAKKIVIFSHIRPDWDAISSLLLAQEILKTTFPEKIIIAALENGHLSNAEFLPGYETILQANATEIITQNNPDCIIIVDCPDFTRISFSKDEIVRQYNSFTLPTIGIDHHDRTADYTADFISNHGFSSAAEEIQELFIKTFGFSETKNSLTCLASGILGDTNNFLFLKNSYENTFSYAVHLLKNGINFAEIDRKQNMYSPHQRMILAEFLKNTVIEEGVTSTCVTDEFVKNNPEIPRDRYSEAKEIMSLRFIRQFSDNPVVIIMYPEGDGYKGSLRGVQDLYDLTIFGKYLNGGGHKSAVGFKLTEPKTITEAMEYAKKVIREHKEEAKINS